MYPRGVRVKRPSYASSAALVANILIKDMWGQLTGRKVVERVAGRQLGTAQGKTVAKTGNQTGGGNYVITRQELRENARRHS